MKTLEKAYAQLKKLPDPLIEEVIDFIGYLDAKNGDATLMKMQEKSLRTVWNNPEDDVWDSYESR